MANGCIPVVTALPGNRMHLKDGVNSLLIHEIQDEKILVQEGVQIITELTKERNLCSRLSEECLPICEKTFQPG